MERSLHLDDKPLEPVQTARRLRHAVSTLLGGLNRWHVLLIGIWTAEIFYVQHCSLDVGLWGGTIAYRYARTRLLLDVLMVSSATVLLPRAWLAATLAANAFFSATVLAYFLYYDRALSLVTVLAQMGEGAAVAGAGLEVLGHWIFILAALLGLKLGVLQLAHVGARGRPIPRLIPGATLVGAYLIAMLVGNLTQRPLQRLETWADVGSVGYVYGYLPTWLGELYYTRGNALLDRAVARGEISSDKLTPHEAPLPLRRNLVFLQVESLDYAVIDFTIDQDGVQVPVTPRLNDLRHRSMFYKTQARKFVGSCDSDFTALTGKLASRQIPVYRLENYPYQDTFMDTLRDAGFATKAVHGVSGRFFNRRYAFEAMGFDQLQFREELVPALELKDAGWTVDDHVLLDHAARELGEARGRNFQIVITATSHMPFRYTPTGEDTFFPGVRRSTYKYFDAMRYVDRSVGAYLDALPPDTTVVIYGDHWSKIKNEQLGYDHEMNEGFGMVPLFVYNVGEDISDLQQTRDAFATSGELELQDMMTWIHGSVGDQLPARPLLADPGQALASP